MAARHGISRQTVAEIWRAFGLKLWRQDEFKISPDPDLIEKIRDLVGLYLSAPVAAAVYAEERRRHVRTLGRRDPASTTPITPVATAIAPTAAEPRALWTMVIGISPAGFIMNMIMKMATTAISIPATQVAEWAGHGRTQQDRPPPAF